jgi:hypothetical protein
MANNKDSDLLMAQSWSSQRSKKQSGLVFSSQQLAADMSIQSLNVPSVIFIPVMETKLLADQHNMCGATKLFFKEKVLP